MGFDEDIASEGKQALPILLTLLRNEPEEYRQSDLIWVVEVMHREFVPLNENKEVIETVSKVVSRMKDPAWQRISQKSLQVIRAKPGTPGPQPRTFP